MSNSTTEKDYFYLFSTKERNTIRKIALKHREKFQIKKGRSYIPRSFILRLFTKELNPKDYTYVNQALEVIDGKRKNISQYIYQNEVNLSKIERELGLNKNTLIMARNLNSDKWKLVTSYHKNVKTSVSMFIKEVITIIDYLSTLLCTMDSVTYYIHFEDLFKHKRQARQNIENIVFRIYEEDHYYITTKSFNQLKKLYTKALELENKGEL